MLVWKRSWFMLEKNTNDEKFPGQNDTGEHDEEGRETRYRGWQEKTHVKGVIHECGIFQGYHTGSLEKNTNDRIFLTTNTIIIRKQPGEISNDGKISGSVEETKNERKFSILIWCQKITLDESRINRRQYNLRKSQMTETSKQETI